jgi:hypothetical protein
MTMFYRREWRYGSNIKNRDYLKENQSFEDLVEKLSARLNDTDNTKVKFQIEPKNEKYKQDGDPLLKVLRCKRAAWWIQLDRQLLDKFFNGGMGLRAQYYLNPYIGRKKNLSLISKLKDSLIRIASEIEKSLDQDFVRRSLSQSSAKVWISERDISEKKIVRAGDLTLDDQSIQNDWIDIAQDVKKGLYGGDDYQLYSAAINGVQAPIADQLEIKGAWLTEKNQHEYVPSDKRDRDCQIFMFGFS